jgi:predicted RNA-binding protein with PUA-like domain
VSRVWILQANPKQFDIDAALSALGEIWWRVPQYTADVHANDIAVMWRSGKESGIVGVGRIVTDPQQRAFDPAELSFLRNPEESVDDATRVLVRFRRCDLIPKDVVKALDGLSDHPIVVAPMGTVFPLTEVQWAALEPLLPTIFAATSEALPELPPSFAWAQRTKGVAPMPGGYSGYLGSLASVCELITEERPTPQALPTRLEALLGVSASGARQRASFLRKVGIIDEHSGVCRLGTWAFHWRESGDPRVIAALLHSRCQFIGEMLAEAREPVSPAELLAVAGQRYGLGWDTQTQINNRRGWMQSAGMLEPNVDGKLQITAAGASLLEGLGLFEPSAEAVSEHRTQPTESEPLDGPEVVETPVAKDAVNDLVAELRESSVDSGNPNRLERATTAAFAFLGFDAEWLGGAGKTDVLLEAHLGQGSSYRVIIDCKSSGANQVGDQQIDWDTLDEHRAKHDAHYVALVAPSPSGKRLFDRAHDHGVTVISVEQLAGLCKLHAKTPLGLFDYQRLFDSAGEVDTQYVDERAEDAERLMVLASAICLVIRQESQVFGRFSARDVLLTLRGEPLAESTTEEELQVLLDTLSSPLLAVVEGTSDTGYLVSSSPAVAEMRVRAVAAALGGSTVE